MREIDGFLGNIKKMISVWNYILHRTLFLPVDLFVVYKVFFVS